MNSDLGHSVSSASQASTTPPAEPLQFLCENYRFKLSFNHYECDECGATSEHEVLTVFENWQKELDGRWVALVPAEDDRHMRMLAAHRTVEGSPESGSRITPDAPASPAQPQGEREAFEAWLRTKEWFQPHHLYRRDMKGSTRFDQYVCTDVESAWLAWQARASLRASHAVPVTQDERAEALQALVEALESFPGFAADIGDERDTFVRKGKVALALGRASLRASTQPERSAEVGWVLVEGAATENGKAARPYFDAKLSDLPLGRHRLYIDAAQPAVSAEARTFTEPTVVLPTRIVRGALEAIEAGANAWVVMNVDYVKEQLRAAMGTPPADNKENGNGR